MNEFTIKKLAEVQAFIATGRTILERSNNFGSRSPDAVSIVEATGKVDLSTSIPDEHKQLFTDKVEKTTGKLAQMMELYVGDEWDNPVEVMEWTSFFAGAGAAHAGLTASATEPANPELSKSLGSLQQAYHDLLDSVIDQLKTVAAGKAQAA